MTDQIIYDRGYRSYEGPRLGPPGARRAILKDGVRRVLGLGRKARMKIFPWLLISIGLAVAAGLIGAHWLIGDLAESVGDGLVPSYGEMFDIYGWIALLFIALAGPQLLIPDRSRGVLSVYFSRPLTVDGYLTSKAGAFVAVRQQSHAVFDSAAFDHDFGGQFVCLARLFDNADLVVGEQFSSGFQTWLKCLDLCHVKG